MNLILEIKNQKKIDLMLGDIKNHKHTALLKKLFYQKGR